MALRIGQVAEGAGVNIQTVRYYERRGLMPVTARTESGYRQYDRDAVSRLHFIKRAKELGFSLEEVAELLELRIEDADVCTTVGAKTKQKIAAVDRKIDELARIRGVLVGLARACDEREPTGDCPILEALREDE